MSEAAIRPEKDFSKEADKQIAESEKVAKVGMASLVNGGTSLTYLKQTDLQSAIEKLSVLEKQTRQVCSTRFVRQPHMQLTHCRPQISHRRREY